MKKSLTIVIISFFVFTVFSPINLGFNIKNTSIESESIYSVNDEIDWWPMFHHDLNRSGHSSSSGPKTNNVLWATKVTDKIGQSFAIVDNKLYFGGYGVDNCFYCLDANTGEILWKKFISKGVYCSPTVIDGRVYFVSRWDSYIFYCLDANNGSIIWEYPLGSHTRSPMVYEGKVYFGTSDGDLYCLNSNTGEEIWVSYINPGLRAAAFFDEKIYISSESHSEINYFYCINASNGDILWYLKSDDWIGAPSTIFKESVYFGDSGGVFYCVDLNSGKVRWKFRTNFWIHTSPCVGDDKIFFHRTHWRLYCLDALNGEKLWEFKTLTGHEIKDSPIFVDGMIYFSVSNGQIFCVNTSSGELTWKYESGDYTVSTPAAANGKVYFGNYHGWIFCFGVESNNKPPNTPSDILGPRNGTLGVKYSYNTSTFDPDGDQLYYKWDWDLGETDWIGPFNSNETVQINITFSYYYMVYEIRVIARDTKYATSEWTKIKVNIPRNRATIGSSWLRFLDMFPILQKILNYII